MSKQAIVEIRPDDLSDGNVIKLLQEHRLEMLKHSPPESVHALDLQAMQHEDVSFFSASYDGEFAACGALKHHESSFAELKSMKTADGFLRQGIGRLLLEFLIAEARDRGYLRLLLETGSMGVFVPARELYLSSGFVQCGAFGGYADDGYSVFMGLDLL